jgi:hypothetical protein
MSAIEICITGTEAKSFAQKLEKISGIKRLEDDYREKAGAFIVFVIGANAVIADTVTNFQAIERLYHEYRKRQSVEVEVRQDRRTYDLPEFLATCAANSPEILDRDLPSVSLPSLQEIAKLPPAERHRILSPFVSDMAKDFQDDSELTVFSVLDGEGIR